MPLPETHRQLQDMARRFAEEVIRPMAASSTARRGSRPRSTTGWPNLAFSASPCRKGMGGPGIDSAPTRW